MSSYTGYNVKKSINDLDDEYNKNNFVLPVPICKLKDEKFIIPEFINKIWIDVGTSINCPNGTQFLKRNNDGFVIGVEPNPQMYFTIPSLYFIRQNKWLVDNKHPSAEIEKNKRIKNQKRQIFNDTEEIIEKEDFKKRFIILPCAINETSEFTNMYSNVHEGSSSLNPNWNGCDKNDTIPIFTIPLSDILSKIPDRFEYIDHLKIDCESLDLKVVKSCGKYLQKIVVITVEDENVSKYLLNNGFEFLERQNGGISYINKKFLHLKNKIDYFIRV